MAQVEGVAGLVYQTSEVHGWRADIPDSIREELAHAYYATTAENHLLFIELERILNCLYDAQVPVIALKGAALAPTIYSDTALRPMNDLDLLVKPEDLRKAKRALRPLGFQQQFINRHVLLTGGLDTRVNLELHWQMYAAKSAHPIPEQWFWECARPIAPRQFSTQFNCLTLPPTANLLYLAGHLIFGHRSHRLRLIWCFDIHLLITQQEERVDWDELLARARSFGWSGALFQTLLIVRERFDTPLPPGLLTVMEQDVAAEGTMASGLITPELEMSVYAKKWRALMALGWLSRMQMMWSLLFPSEVHMKMYYRPEPDWLWWLYYPIRWINIIIAALSIRK
jgi:hypothetical protein